MLLGLKVLATAGCELKVSGDEHYLLQCDYRIIKNDIVDTVSFLVDSLKPLSVDVQKFVLQLHQRFMDKKLKCVVSKMNLYIRFIYSYKVKEVIRLNVSLNNGYDIGIRAKNAHKYTDTIEKFPVWLQEKIRKGYGCGKKLGLTASCNGGCRGIRIPLDESLIDARDDIETWFDLELSFL